MPDVVKSAEAIVKANTSGAEASFKKLATAEERMGRGALEAAKQLEKLQKEAEGARAAAESAAQAAKISAANSFLQMGRTALDAAAQIREFAKESVQVQATMQSLQIDISGARDATMGLVNDMDLATAANQAVFLGAVDTAEGFEQMAGAAAKVAMATGQDARKGIDDITIALGRASPKILDNLGVIVDEEKAYKEFAESVGKSASELTEAERKTVFKTIALEGLLEKADQVTISEDSLALAAERMGIQVENARLKIQGADDSMGALRSALDSLGDEIVTLDLENYAADWDKVDEALKKYGASVESVGGKTQVLTAFLEKQRNVITKMNAAADEEEKRKKEAPIRQRIKNLKDESKELEFQTQLAKAEGIEQQSLEYLKLSQLELTRDRLLEQEKVNEATREEIDLANQAIQLQEARIATSARETSNKRGGGGRSKRKTLEDLIDPGQSGVVDTAEFATDLLEIIDELQNATARAADVFFTQEYESQVATQERMIEVLRARGEETTEAEIRLEKFKSKELEYLGRIQEANDAAHQANLIRLAAIDKREEELAKAREKRLKEEKKEQEQRIKYMDKVVDANTSGMKRVLAQQIENGELSGEAFFGEVGALAKSRAIMLGVDSAFHAAEAVGWALAGNPIKATMEANAAGKLGVEAAAMGALAATFTAISGTGGTQAGPAGIQGNGGAFALGSGAPTGGQADPTAPVSPLEEDLSRNTSSVDKSQKQGVTNVYVEGAVVDGEKLMRIIQDQERNFGRFKS